MRSIFRPCLLCIAVASAALCLFSASGLAQPPLKAAPEDMQWWQDARFGLFIHWGPVSIKGTEIGWSRDGERRGTKSGPGAIPAAEYDALYKQFNPEKFNAREWVALAKSAGMKYLVFTTKHHDGFCMFDADNTDYKITNSPFKRDIVAELAQACHEAGLRLGFYYSPPDWHSADYRTERHAQYQAYLHEHIRELCTKYGQLDILWFDGLGGTAQDWDAENLFQEIRALQPKILINNRCGLEADFDTPEQTIGRFQRTRPWESCITICQQWAWKPDDEMKTMEQCISTLVRCAGGDGNLLFNVGPMPTGEIEPRQADRLREMGAWLAKYGETIYGTRGGPWRTSEYGACTSKGNTAFLHCLEWPGASLTLPPISVKLTGSRVLTGGAAEVVQAPDGSVSITVAPDQRATPDTIVALDFDGPVDGLILAEMPSNSLACGKPCEASNTYQKMTETYGPEKALDDNPDTRWATDAGLKAAWLQVDLGAKTTFDQVLIQEAIPRVQAFTLEAFEDGAWKPFHKGTEIGAKSDITFPTVRAQKVRLNIQQADDGPTITEFQVLSKKDLSSK